MTFRNLDGIVPLGTDPTCSKSNTGQNSPICDLSLNMTITFIQIMLFYTLFDLACNSAGYFFFFKFKLIISNL